MKDIQNQHDNRNIPIDKVGIKDLKYVEKFINEVRRYEKQL